MYAPLGDASRHCVHGQDRSVIPEQDKQSGAVFKLWHDLLRVRFRRQPIERVKILRHENVSNDPESQFLPQLAENRWVVASILTKTVGTYAPPVHAAIQVHKRGVNMRIH